MKMKVFLALFFWSPFLVITECSVLSQSSTFNAKLKSRIIGGTNAFSGQFPFAAAITVHTSSSRHFCGGTLLDQQWILTASQCAAGAILFEITLGSNTINNEDPNAVHLSTAEFFTHPDFNFETLENDIALIKLRIPIQFSNYVSATARLPTESINEDKTVLAIGWGQENNQNAELAQNLKWVILSSISNLECRLTYGDQVKENMVCVAGNYNEGTCTGDAGGPLIEILNRGEIIIHAVASFFSLNGCESSDPSGFTRVYPYVQWIANVTASDKW